MPQLQQCCHRNDEHRQAAQGKNRQERQQEPESAGLDRFCARNVTPGEQDRHLVIGVGLNTIVQGTQVVHACAKRNPLAVHLNAGAIELQKERRNQQLRQHCQSLAQEAGEEQLQNASQSHAF